MEKREPDTTGDYGYDLVHEEVRTGRPSAGESGRPGSTTHASGRDDPGQDYGYDEAHDF